MTDTMATNAQPKWMTWAGWVLSGLVIAFMIMEVAMKLMRMPQVETTGQALGLPPGMGFTIGLIELVCLVFYAFPRTKLLGAILFTGVLGGAICTHLRVGSPLFSHTLFGVYLGLMTWGGIWLRDPRLRALMPLSRS